MTTIDRTLRQPVPTLFHHSPLCILSYKFNVWTTARACRSPALVLCPIKDKHCALGRFRGNQIGFLGHVTRAINLAIVVDCLLDADFGRCLLV